MRERENADNGENGTNERAGTGKTKRGPCKVVNTEMRKANRCAARVQQAEKGQHRTRSKQHKKHSQADLGEVRKLLRHGFELAELARANELFAALALINHDKQQ